MTLRQEINGTYDRYKEVEKELDKKLGDEREPYVTGLRDALTAILCAVAQMENGNNLSAEKKVDDARRLLETIG